jgi:hypothetical protein
MPKMRIKVELVSPSDDGEEDDDGAVGIGGEGRGPLGVLGDCPPTNDAVGRAGEVTAVRSSSIRAPRPPNPADTDWMALAAPRAGMVGEADDTVFPAPLTGVGAVGETGPTSCAGGRTSPPPLTGAATFVTGARTAAARLVTGVTTGLTVLVTGARTGAARLVTGVTTGLTVLVTGARVWATGAVIAPAVCATVPSVWVTGAATVPSVWVTGAATVPRVWATGAVPRVWATGAVTAPAAGVAVPRVGATALVVATVDVTGPVTAPAAGVTLVTAPAAGVAVPRVGATALAVATVDVTGRVTAPAPWVVTGPVAAPVAGVTFVTAPAAGVAVPRVGATALGVATVDVTGRVTAPAPWVVTGPVAAPAAGVTFVTVTAPAAGVAVPRVGATALAVATVETGVGGAAGVVAGVPTVTGVDELAVPLVGGAAAGGVGLDGPVAGAATPSLDETTGLCVELATPPTPDGKTADVGIPRADALPDPRSTTKATTAKIPNTRRANAWTGRATSVAPHSCLFAFNRVFMDVTGSRLFGVAQPIVRSDPFTEVITRRDRARNPSIRPTFGLESQPSACRQVPTAMPAGSFRSAKRPQGSRGLVSLPSSLRRPRSREPGYPGSSRPKATAGHAPLCQEHLSSSARTPGVGRRLRPTRRRWNRG